MNKINMEVQVSNTNTSDFWEGFGAIVNLMKIHISLPEYNKLKGSKESTPVLFQLS